MPAWTPPTRDCCWELAAKPARDRCGAAARLGLSRNHVQGAAVALEAGGVLGVSSGESNRGRSATRCRPSSPWSSTSTNWDSVVDELAEVPEVTEVCV